MIAFLFLTYDAICKEDIWTQYFSVANPNDYKIFVHPKNINKIHKQNLFKNCIIPHRCETKWGDFSLIEAQKLLLAEALKDSNITHCIFVSHNAIPLTSFYHLYNFLQSKNSLISYWKTTLPVHKNRYDKLQNKPNFSKEQFLLQSQWCILSKNDATIILKEHDKIKHMFNHSCVPDEHAYINYLVNCKNITNVEGKSTTHIAWNGDTPKIFNTLSNEEINKIRTSGKFFLRKITDNTKVDVNYLLQK